ncbi:hypothetical protein D7Y09_06695 [bacterium 1XD42-1]|nr:hypothetical protein D7X25_05490 [bacterium 1XD42-8]RKJ65230.1 hypothetical protein D7Y09_06695 [bacterium 1XD42-1]
MYDFNKKRYRFFSVALFLIFHAFHVLILLNILPYPDYVNLQKEEEKIEFHFLWEVSYCLTVILIELIK